MLSVFACFILCFFAKGGEPYSDIGQMFETVLPEFNTSTHSRNTRKIVLITSHDPSDDRGRNDYQSMFFLFWCVFVVFVVFVSFCL